MHSQVSACGVYSSYYRLLTVCCLQVRLSFILGPLVYCLSWCLPMARYVTENLLLSFFACRLLLHSLLPFFLLFLLSSWTLRVTFWAFEQDRNQCMHLSRWASAWAPAASCTPTLARSTPFRFLPMLIFYVCFEFIGDLHSNWQLCWSPLLHITNTQFTAAYDPIVL